MALRMSFPGLGRPTCANIPARYCTINKTRVVGGANMKTPGSNFRVKHSPWAIAAATTVALVISVGLAQAEYLVGRQAEGTHSNQQGVVVPIDPHYYCPSFVESVAEYGLVEEKIRRSGSQ